MIRIALAALVVLVLAGIANAAPDSVVVGDLVLDYDDARWLVLPRTDGVVLLAADCTSFPCKEAGIVITFAPPVGPFPTDIAQSGMGFVKPLWDLVDDAAPWPGEGAVREINGFTIFATDRWSGCRAMSPSELTAILDHAGRRYTFTSGVAMGCGGVWGVDRAAFVAILEGLRPRT